MMTAMMMDDSKEIAELLSEIPKCQSNEFKGESEHIEEELSSLTEPNDSLFRVRRLSRSFSIPSGKKEQRNDKTEDDKILMTDENRESSINLGKSKFILLKRSRSLGNIFLPDQILKEKEKKEEKDNEVVENLTEKFEALEIEVFSSKADSKIIKGSEINFPIIDRPQTSPPILYPSVMKTDENKSTSTTRKPSILDRMQKSLGFLFKCARKDEGSSEEEGNLRKFKYPIRSRTPDAKLLKRLESKTSESSDVPMQAINFITKVDESPKCSEIVKKLPHFIDVNGPKGPLLQPQNLTNEGKKCLVLDLDETLVHSSFHVPESHDLVVSLGLPDGSHQNIYVAKRPGVDQFLARVSEDFEVVIFTASLSHYADPVIDFLTMGMNRYLKEPRNISLRLYRESCLFLRGLYVKDLSRLGRKLEHTVIVDNSPASFLLQPEHGIPIKSWFNDVNDRELPLLQESLEHFIDANSVSEWRIIINNLYYPDNIV